MRHTSGGSLGAALIGLTGLMAAPNGAWAGDGAAFAANGYIDGNGKTMEAWLAQQWCGSYDPETSGVIVPDAAWQQGSSEYVVTNLQLSEQWGDWSQTVSADLATCRPNAWFIRLANAALLADWLPAFRSTDGLAHTLTSGIALDGNPVQLWMADWVGPLSPHGYVWTCENLKPAPGLTTSAANPDGDEPSILYYAFFWKQGVAERAATLVHEAAHERSTHYENQFCDSPIEPACAKQFCGLGASCDYAYNYPNEFSPDQVNAQTANIHFLMDAMDAYTQQKKESGKPLVYWNYSNFNGALVKNFGDGTCGYAPLLTAFDRAGAFNAMRSKLAMNFRLPLPSVAYPLVAQMSASGTYAIDLANGARWPCDAVCDPQSFTFDATGAASTATGCNETLQPGNRAINEGNRALCEAANLKVAKGLTPAQRTAAQADLKAQLQSCEAGVAPEVVAATCDTAIANASTTTAVAALWSLLDTPGFDTEAAIRACQSRFCTERASIKTPGAQDAAAACFEFDGADPVTACPDPCGALEPNLTDTQYFERVVCRYARATGANPPAEFYPPATTGGCAAVYLSCGKQAELAKKVDAWKAEKNAGTCWFDAFASAAWLPPIYTYSPAAKALGSLSFQDFLGLQGAADILTDPCMPALTVCQTQEILGLVLLGELAIDDFSKPPKPDFGDGWKADPFIPTFDTPTTGYRKGVARALKAAVTRAAGPRVGSIVDDPTVRGVFASAETLSTLGASAGIGHWRALFGASAGDELFSPRLVATFVDSGGVDGLGAPLGEREVAMKTLVGFRAVIDQGKDADLFSKQLPGASRALVFAAYQQILGATSAAELDAAYVGLRAAIGGP